MPAVLIGGAAGKAGRILDRAVEALCARASSVASSCNISADVLVVWFFDITASVQMP
jgi:hypothetical protein